MGPKLYYHKISPPSRAVFMCANTIGLDLDVVETSLINGDHLKPEFVKRNPLHTIPTLDDDGFILYDSHAIMGYIVGKYAKDKSLYPEDVQKRALIDQRLHFDSGVLFARHLRVALPIFLQQVTTVVEENANALREAYDFVEIFLKGSKYIAGDDLSIADFSIFNSISNARVAVPLDEDTHPNIVAWTKLLETTMPYYEVNKEGVETFKTLLQSFLSG